MIRTILITALLTNVFLFHSTAAADDAIAKKKYSVCAGCHGFKGEGSEMVSAPALAGQELWYLKRQIVNFQTGVRGGDGDDVKSKSMATMVKTLSTPADVQTVAEYLHKLPANEPSSTLDGDATRGESLYASCVACHGASAEGNATLNSPALDTMSDWYMLDQLKKFKSGARGKHPGDVYGQQMAPMVATLADEQAMKDVVAYIGTL